MPGLGSRIYPDPVNGAYDNLVIDKNHEAI